MNKKDWTKLVAVIAVCAAGAYVATINVNFGVMVIIVGLFLTLNW